MPTFWEYCRVNVCFCLFGCDLLSDTVSSSDYIALNVVTKDMKGTAVACSEALSHSDGSEESHKEPQE
jgi:hypothetical protein